MSRLIALSRLTPPLDLTKVHNENGVKLWIKSLLNAHGWYTWMPGAGGYASNGVHDHLAIKNGVFLTIEAKYGGNKPSALQKGFAAHILANDGYSFCVNEKNIDHLAYWLESFEIATQHQLRGEPIPAEHGSRMLNAISALTDLFK